MKSRFFLIIVALLAGLFAFLPTSQVASFTVTQTDDATTLVSTLIQAGITVVGTPTYTGTNQSGTFTNFNSGPYTNPLTNASGQFGYSSGIIMTSGYAANAATPYPGGISAGANSSMGGGGNSLLNTLSGKTTYDAAVLSFQFKSQTSNLYFHYAFASTEYPQYVNSPFNDVFGFFLNGQNLALVPGTSTPIAVNNVNLGNSNNAPDIASATNPQYFTQYSVGGTPFNYGGLTVDFLAQGTVVPGETNTMTLAIADASDHVLDSAVFIEGGSFGGDPDSTPGAVPEPATMLLLGSGLIGLAGYGRKKFFKK
jgi:PEP-CTERM motif